MRILHISNAYKPAYRMGGTVFTSQEITRRQVALGHQVTVFTTNCNADEDLDVPVDSPQTVDGVEVWYFKRKEYIKTLLPFVPYLSKSTGFLYAPRLRSELRRVLPEFDVVHTHTPFVYTTYAGCCEARKTGTPVVYQAHGSLDPGRLEFRSHKKRLYISLIERRLMNSATLLLALTRAEADGYKAIGVNGDCEIVPNGVDVAAYAVQHEGIAARKFGLSDDATLVLFLGRIHRQKGADSLLEAFIAASGELSNAVLLMAGPDEHDLEKQFKRRVAEAGLTKRVVFAGMVSGELKRDLLARANLFCLPSDGEGFSIALLEALASGTATLISPGCHFPEIESAGLGLQVDPKVKNIADALLALVRDPDRLRRMGLTARDFVSRTYDWDSVVNRLIEVYGRAIHMRKVTERVDNSRAEGSAQRV
jgi:glycosyltransferase involved in cell wall biosynthesis